MHVYWVKRKIKQKKHFADAKFIIIEINNDKSVWMSVFAMPNSIPLTVYLSIQLSSNHFGLQLPTCINNFSGCPQQFVFDCRYLCVITASIRMHSTLTWNFVSFEGVLLFDFAIDDAHVYVSTISIKIMGKELIPANIAAENVLPLWRR